MNKPFDFKLSGDKYILADLGNPTGVGTMVDPLLTIPTSGSDLKNVVSGTFSTGDLVGQSQLYGDGYCEINVSGSYFMRSDEHRYVDDLTINFYAPNNMSIDTIDNILNAPTTTVTAGGQAYTLGNTMAQGSEVSITVSTASVIRLNVTNF